MRVAVFVGTFPSVSETFILRQIEGLLALGHDVEVYARHLCFRDDLHGVGQDVGMVGRARLLGQPGIFRRLLGAPSAAWRLARRQPVALAKLLDVRRYGRATLSLRLLHESAQFAASGPYDVLHAHFATTSLPLLPLRRLNVLRAPLVTTFHGGDLNVAGSSRPGLYRELFRFGELFTANSRFTALVAQAQGCPPDKIHLLPMGLDTRQHPFRPRQLCHGRRVRLLSVGRLVEVKGFEYAIEAVSHLGEYHSRIEYTIVGDGPRRADLSQLIARLELGRIVRLAGAKSQEELRQIYDQSDLLIFPSVTGANGATETQGLVLQEAQASGLPVVATRYGGVPEGVVPGKSARLVGERDALGIAREVRWLIEHPAEWAAMGRVGRAFVEKNYDIQRLTKRLEGLFALAIESREHGCCVTHQRRAEDA